MGSMLSITSHDARNDLAGIGCNGASYEVSKSWAYAKRFTAKAQHKLKIDNINWQSTSRDWISSKFDVSLKTNNGIIKKLKFSLDYYLNSGQETPDIEGQNSDSIGVVICSHNEQEELILIGQLSLEDCFGGLFGEKSFEFSTKSQNQNQFGFLRTFLKSQILDNKATLLPNNTLTIVCDLEIRSSDHVVHSSEEVGFASSDFPTLADDLMKFRENKTVTDVVLKCQQKTFKVHKFILSARSDVFSAMFSYPGNLEASSNEVNIEDTDPDTLDLFLQFIYTDQVSFCNKFDNCEMKLLLLADKYNVPRLKCLCEEALRGKLKLSNAIDTLILAYLHNLGNLKSFTTNYVHFNRIPLCHTPEWLKLGQYPALLSKVCLADIQNHGEM